MNAGAVAFPSPNFDARSGGASPRWVVLHYTGMVSAEAARARLCDPASRVSAHYLIGEDGTLDSLVREEDRAWHAGQSFWRGETDLNSASLGIELVNPGHEFGYRPFPAAQIAALRGLLKDVFGRYGLKPDALLGHSDIAPLRKQDPGELFPWPELARQGFGLWPSPQPEDYAAPRDGEVPRLLERLGYQSPPASTAPETPCPVLLAFQRRYNPAALTGRPDPETLARLRALAREGGV